MTIENKKEIKNLITCSFYGSAIGDALGVPVEFCSREELDTNPITAMMGNGTYNQEKGTFSDDTSLSLATAIGLCSKNNTDVLYNIADEFKEWFYNGKYAINNKVFDVGNSTAKAIGRYAITNLLFDNTNESSYYSNGNGSLMRILPVAFYMYGKEEFNTLDKRKKFVSDVSALTHSHIISKMCCVIYCEIVLEIITEKINNTFDIDNLLTSISKVMEQVYHSYTLSKDSNEYMREFTSIFHLLFLLFSRDKVKSNGYVINTLESVLWCIANTHSYKEAVLTAVNLGGDTDTIASLVGGLAGLIYRYNDIPNEWISCLQGKKMINGVIKKFSKSIIKSQKWIILINKKRWCLGARGMSKEESIAKWNSRVDNNK